jgi:PAS domain S-box-containing protein
LHLDAMWWAELERFDDLAFATLDRARASGATSVVIGVVDAAGEAHFVHAGSGSRSEVEPGLRAALRGANAPPPAGWTVTTLRLGRRIVGGVALQTPAVSSDEFDQLYDQLAVAVDVIAARYGRTRLRAGLTALRRISSRFSGALTVTEIAQCATNEGVGALGAARCLVYRLDDAALELVAEDSSDHTSPNWARIALATPAPVSDCVRDRAAVTLASRNEILARYPFMADHPTVADEAWMAIPLVVDGRATGALFFAFHEPHSFTPDELALAGTIADQCAQALERARLQRALDDRREGESERRFRAALDSMTDLVTIETAVRDGSGAIVDFWIDYMNQVDIDVAGRGAGAITGRRLLDAYPAMRDSELFRGYVQVAETGVPLVVDELPYTDTIDGQDVSGYYSVQIAKFGDGIIISSRDISAARRSRLELEAAYEQLAAARGVARLGIWSVDLATADVTFSEEMYEMFGFDPGLPVPSLADAILQFIDPHDIELVQALVETTPITREPFMVEITGRRTDGSRRTLMVAGTVSVDQRGEPTRFWGTAQDITEQRLAEQALRETTEQLEREHTSLLMLQDAISPTLPDLEHVEVHGVYVPAGEHTHVGGDWLDAVALDNGRLALVVGDVAGHGIAAAALMAELRHALRAYLAEGMAPTQALAALNRVAHLDGDEPYATCLTAIYNPATRALMGASAGHLPYVVARGGKARLYDVNVGPPIGARPNAEYRAFGTVLEPRDTMLFFTDGLIERRGELIDDGLERLLATVELENDDPQPLPETCARICSRLRPDGPTQDDLCLLALRLP